MSRFFWVMAIFCVWMTTLTGCATAAKKAAVPATSGVSDARDAEIEHLKTELDEQKVRAAEAEARAAKAENDLREIQLTPSAKPKDPYLK